jgi:hypothetical protein
VIIVDLKIWEAIELVASGLEVDYMASATIGFEYFKTENTDVLQGRITWSSTINRSANTSTVTVNIQARRSDTYTTTGYWNVWTEIWRMDGNTTGPVTDGVLTVKSDEKTSSISVGSDWVTLKTYKFTVPHMSNGKQHLAIYTSIDAPEGTTLEGGSVYTNGFYVMQLDTIVKTASITSASSFTDEGTPTVKYSNPAGSNATVAIGLFWDKAGTDALIGYTTVTGTSGTKTFTLTTAQKNAIYSKMANVKTKTIYYRIRTTIDGNNYVSSVAKTLTIVNATPTLSPTAVENTDADDEDGSKNVAATGSASRWLKNYSDIKYAFNASAKKGATIKSYSVKCGSKVGSAASGTLYNIDSATVKFTVTDSRGNTATKTVTGTLVDYIKLTCSLSATGTLDTGNTAKATLKVSGNFFNGQIKSGTNNSLTLQYRYKLAGGSYSSWTNLTPSISGNGYTCSYTIPTSFDYQSTCTVQTRARDGFYVAHESYVVSNEVVVKAEPVFDWGSNDFKFNVALNLKESMYFVNNNKGITGVCADATPVSALVPCNASNNLLLGYGGYEKEIGATNIYGNRINLLSKTGIYIDDKKHGEQTILHTDSGRYMNADQSVTLTGAAALSKQHTGYILVWYYYSGGLLAQQIQYTYIPKIAPTIKNVIALPITLDTGEAGMKKLTVTDDGTTTVITGDSFNSNSSPENKFVLRYIVGY